MLLFKMKNYPFAYERKATSLFLHIYYAEITV